MHDALRTSFVLALLFSAAPVYAAQSVDPSGHWEGTIESPLGSMTVEVDLAKNAAGELSGTLGSPEENLKGLPLLNVSIEGQTVSFEARTDQPFSGTLSADGKSLSGSLSLMGSSIPLSFVRTGEAQIEGPEKSPRISPKLEGTWTGIIAAQGEQLHLVLTLANQPDGGASGRIVNLDEGGITVPATIQEAGSGVTLQFKAVAASFAGALSDGGTVLAGTYKQGAESFPLRFERSVSKQ
jgi:hypothetical protein